MKAFRQILLALLCGAGAPGLAQQAPSPAEIAAFGALHRAAHEGDHEAVTDLIAAGADLELRDGAGRTPLLVAVHASRDQAVRALARAGADLDAQDRQAYDAVTIAAVAGDLPMLDLVLSLGADPGAVTSPYRGTALIAAADRGHAAVVARLIEAGAPLDHVNNLGWTALMEAVVLGDGGADYLAIVSSLVEAGADPSIADRQGTSPLEHACARGYGAIAAALAGTGGDGAGVC